MVGHDHIDSGPAQSRDGRERSRTAVTGYDDLCSGGNRRVDARIAQVVAVLDAARYERSRFSPEGANRPSEERRRANAIDVVVAVHEHELLVANGASETVDRFVHRKEAERIV